jgi:hypothetical protein
VSVCCVYSFTAIASGDVILAMSQKRKVPPILWTMLCVLLLALGATSYAKTANSILIVVRLSLLVVTSVLVVQEWWNYQQRSRSRNMRRNTGSNLLRRWRRWATDEAPTARQPSSSQIMEGGCYEPGPPRRRVGEILVLILVVAVIAALTLWRK